ncbi:MAG: VanZ family protein [Brachybacterium sp.]|uniref:VanZ family protein n=1 Tax=Brachybacterium sp. TaxID=1891286 RepID=UPI0026476171|nr:VanZ family protein [Brachybacterium sp.]MDN5687301.1 VanZ family protein [Brachybacterium sp.]
MNEFLRLGVVGVVGGLGVFVIILAPSVLLQRHRFGRVRPLRLVGVAVICIYTMTLAGLTVAPAYEIAETCSNRVGGELRPYPFNTLLQLLEVRAEGTSLPGLLVSWPVLQLAANVVLFMPLGAVLRGVFRLEVTNSLAIGVMLSVLIEATQYTGAWGLYPCGVRIADIDDVFANSLGALLGAFFAPVLTRLRVPLFVHERPLDDDGRRDRPPQDASDRDARH